MIINPTPNKSVNRFLKELLVDLYYIKTLSLENTHFGFVIINPNDFKQVNEVMGQYSVGKFVIPCFSKRLTVTSIHVFTHTELIHLDEFNYGLSLIEACKIIRLFNGYTGSK